MIGGNWRRFAIGEMQFAKCFAHQAFILFPGVGACFLADLAFAGKKVGTFSRRRKYVWVR
jgi:hypothetical protein